MSDVLKQKYLLPVDNPAPDTGRMLSQHFATHQINQSALSRSVGRKHSTVLNYKQHGSIQTGILWALCHALKHNFFADIAAQLPDEYSSNVPATAGKDGEIAALKAEIIQLTRERDFLKDIVKGR